MRDVAAVIAVTDHDPSIAARVGRAAERRATGCGARPERAEQPPLRCAQPDRGLGDARVDTVPTMVLPSRLTLVAPRPPMKMTPVVGIQ